MNVNAGDAAAAGTAARERCSEDTLRGTYLAAYDGVDIGGNAQAPFAAAELVWFDGNGDVRGIGSYNYNGDVTSPPEQFSGTYTVNADCTGTATYPGDPGEPDSTYDLFIAPDGSMFTFVQTSPSNSVASGVYQRVTRRRIGG